MKTQRHGRSHDDGGRASSSGKSRGAGRSRRRKRRGMDSPSEPPAGSTFRHLDSRRVPPTWERMNFCCINAPSLWHFFPAALGKQYSPMELPVWKGRQTDINTHGSITSLLGGARGVPGVWRSAGHLLQPGGQGRLPGRGEAGLRLDAGSRVLGPRAGGSCPGLRLMRPEAPCLPLTSPWTSPPPHLCHCHPAHMVALPQTPAFEVLAHWWPHPNVASSEKHPQVWSRRRLSFRTPSSPSVLQ